MEGPTAKGWMSQSHHKNGSTKPKSFPRLAKKCVRRNGRRTARGNKRPTVGKRTPRAPWAHPGMGPFPRRWGHTEKATAGRSRKNGPPNGHTGLWSHRASALWPWATRDNEDGPPNSPIGPQGPPGHPAELAIRQLVSVDEHPDGSPREKGA
ncbi:hypothetical protein E2562_003147 [Oryza meyeriana var. granulata]|uniref:Uncharacterized protein n=1 Tax=Oryza meyeriana var. granulata TaxID=110450 RepID=A0A6G1EA81_9ORYZ|nr:hypothetical protein E2562_003147 [Oryza meyeriana var. granulata]